MGELIPACELCAHFVGTRYGLTVGKCTAPIPRWLVLLLTSDQLERTMTACYVEPVYNWNCESFKPRTKGTAT
jgi:hypothetical protein